MSIYNRGSAEIKRFRNYSKCFGKHPFFVTNPLAERSGSPFQLGPEPVVLALQVRNRAGIVADLAADPSLLSPLLGDPPLDHRPKLAAVIYSRPRDASHLRDQRNAQAQVLLFDDAQGLGNPGASRSPPLRMRSPCRPLTFRPSHSYHLLVRKTSAGNQHDQPR